MRALRRGRNALQARFLVQDAVLEMRHGSRVLADPWPSIGWRLGTAGNPEDRDDGKWFANRLSHVSVLGLSNMSEYCYI